MTTVLQNDSLRCDCSGVCGATVRRYVVVAVVGCVEVQTKRQKSWASCGWALGRATCCGHTLNECEFVERCNVVVEPGSSDLVWRVARGWVPLPDVFGDLT